jgi:hypothetical protein
MQTEHGWLIGPGDKVLSVNAAGAVTFANTELTDADLLEAAPIGGDYRATVQPVAFPDLLLTADATKFAPSGNACLAYYGAKKADVVGPDGKPGWYQRWAFGQWASGIVTAAPDYIEQGAANGRNWKAQGLTWVKKQ